MKDAAGLRRKLKSVEATCSSLEKQVKQHQEEESSLRQRLMEQRVKVWQGGVSVRFLYSRRVLKTAIARQHMQLYLNLLWQVSRQAGREGKVQEDMESLRQQVAKERAEHEITKQRLSSLHRSQKVGNYKLPMQVDVPSRLMHVTCSVLQMSKEAANAAVNAELQQERQQTADLRDQLADTHHELGKSAEEAGATKATRGLLPYRQMHFYYIPQNRSMRR